MGSETGIAWTDHTANFWMGCQRVSPGCEHCYAETLVTNRMGLKVWGPASTTERKRTASAWKDVPRWDRDARRNGVRRKLFVSSLADIFENHPQVAPWRAEALALLERCANLDVQLLTKRPENILRMVPEHWRAAWPSHVWIGTTVEDQRRAEERIPHLLAVPASVRFLSCEPLLEEVDLTEWLSVDREDPTGQGCEACRHLFDHHWSEAGDDDSCTVDDPPCGCSAYVTPCISWVIVGGESGPGARPFDLAWARSILRQCAEAGVPAFCKQLGSIAVEGLDVTGNFRTHPKTGKRQIEMSFTHRYRFVDRAGSDPSEWPADLRCQQFPEVSRG